MYLGRLKGLLSSAQVSQVVPQVQSVGVFFEKNSMIIPSRQRKFLKGTASAYHTGIFGTAPSYTQKTDKINMVTFSFSALSTSLWPAAYAQAAAVSNSGTAGYRSGGTDGTEKNVIYKLTFSTDAVTTTSAVLSGTARAHSTLNNNATAGYFWSASLGTLGTGINKLTYSNDTRSTLGATQTSGRYAASSASNSGTAGYCAGGEV